MGTYLRQEVSPCEDAAPLDDQALEAQVEPCRQLTQGRVQAKQKHLSQCWGSVTFWCGSRSRSPDPYLWLMDPDPVPDLDPTPDSTPFFIDFKDAKKYFFSPYFFLITCPQAHHLQPKKLIFLLKFCTKILFCRHYFNLLNTFMRKGKDPEPNPDP